MRKCRYFYSSKSQSSFNENQWHTYICLEGEVNTCGRLILSPKPVANAFHVQWLTHAAVAIFEVIYVGTNSRKHYLKFGAIFSLVDWSVSFLIKIMEQNTRCLVSFWINFKLSKTRLLGDCIRSSQFCIYWVRPHFYCDIHPLSKLCKAKIYIYHTASVPLLFAN